MKKVENLIRLLSNATGLWQLELLLVPFIHFREKIFEPTVDERIRDKLGKGWTFVDIGASFGYYTILASMIVGKKGLVVAIEPATKESNVLLYICKFYRLGNIIIKRVAAYSRNCKKTLFLSPHVGFHSFTTDSNKRIQVICNTLDDILYQLKVHGPIFIKVDVEGAEVEVIKGAEKTLSYIRPLCIVVEAHSRELRDEVVQRLKAHDLNPEFLDDHHIYSESVVLA